MYFLVIIKKITILLVILFCFVVFLKKNKTYTSKVSEQLMLSYKISDNNILKKFTAENILYFPLLVGKYKLLIICLIRPEEFDLRSIIRNTTYSECVEPECGYIFVVGSSNDTIMKLLKEESRKEKDMFVTKNIDSYGRAVTEKLHILYQWLNLYLTSNLGKINISWFAKTDSDVFTIIPSIISYTNNFKNGDLYGIIHKGGMIIRNPIHKNYEPKLVGEKEYPLFPSGSLFFFNNKVLKYISNPNNVVYNNEDCAIGLWLKNTSIVMDEIPSVRKNICILINRCHKNNKCFSVHSLSHYSDVFYYKNGLNIPSNYRKMWHNYKKCGDLLYCDGVCYFD